MAETRSVVVVFGGAGGIGAEVAAHLAAEGSRVVIADVNEAEAAARAGALVADGGEAAAVACDIADPGSCDYAAQVAVELVQHQFQQPGLYGGR